MIRIRPDTLLSLMIRVTAIGYLIFFVPSLVLAARHHKYSPSG
jgi:hypothetical protein